MFNTWFKGILKIDLIIYGKWLYSKKYWAYMSDNGSVRSGVRFFAPIDTKISENGILNYEYFILHITKNRKNTLHNRYVELIRRNFQSTELGEN